jgi:hypothetical protein
VAVWAAERGWAVVKIIPGKKKAAEPWKDLGYRDPETVRRIWDGEAVGILTGPSGLVCDDLDVDSEGDPAGAWSLEELADGDWDKIPATFELSTPSGGSQLIWEAPRNREFKTCAGVVAPYFDVRGRGGLFVLYDPTQPLRFVTDDRDPAEMPAWLAEFHPEPGSLNGQVADIPDARAWLEQWGGSMQDQRCRAMAGTWSKRRAGSVHDVMRDTVNALVGDCVAGHIGLNSSLADVRDKFYADMRGKSREREKVGDWRNAIATAIARKVGGRGKPRSGDPCKVDDFDDLEGIGASVKRQKSDKLLAGIKNGAYLSKQKFAPLKYAVPGLVPEGYSVLAGAPFIGKTVILLQFGLACSQGGEVLGIQCEKRHVFYLALESSEPRLQDACFKLLGDDEDIPDWFDYKIEVEPRNLAQTAEAYLEMYPDALILIDTLTIAIEAEPMLKGESTYDRDSRVGKRFKALDKKYTGCTIIASRHTKKGKAITDWVEMVSGTHAIAGAADTLMVLTRTRGAQDGILRTVSRVMDEAEYALLLENPRGWHLDGDDLDEAADKVNYVKRENKLGGRSIDVIDYVNKHASGVSITQIANATGIPFDQSKYYVYTALKRGDIGKIKRGLYGPASKLLAGANNNDDE